MRTVLVFLLAMALAGCATPPRTVKVALVAPFEGRARATGYAAFPALRLALRDAAVQAAAERRALRIEFVAYDDGSDPAKAARVARAVSADASVVAVIGHFEISTTLAALGVYTAAGLPVLVPHVAPEQLPTDPLVFAMGISQAQQTRGLRDAPEVDDLPAARAALVRFTELSLGPPPAPGSIVAYDATNMLIAAIRTDASESPTRAGVASALRAVRHDGLLGAIQFDARQRWAAAPAFPAKGE